MVESELLTSIVGAAFFVIGLVLFFTQVPANGFFFVGGILMLMGILLLTPMLMDVLS